MMSELQSTTSELHGACADGRIEDVRLSLDRGAEVDAADPHGRHSSSRA